MLYTLVGKKCSPCKSAEASESFVTLAAAAAGALLFVVVIHYT